MPPKKAKQAAATAPGKPLDGVVIAFAGRFSNSQARLTEIAGSLGAQVVKSPRDITHAICTDRAIQTPVGLHAATRQLPLMKEAWLLEADKMQMKPQETFGKYRWDVTVNGALRKTTSTQDEVKKEDDEAEDYAAPMDKQINASPEKPNHAQHGVDTNNNAHGTKVGSNDLARRSGEQRLSNQEQASGNKRKQADVKKEDDDEDDKKILADRTAAPKKDAIDSQLEHKKAKIEASHGAAQIAKSKDASIPVDECFPHAGYRVYIDEQGTIWDASLNQTNAGKNNNKFYRLQVLYNAQGFYTTWSRWGRVGHQGQSAQLGSGDVHSAQRAFEQKFKEKTGLMWQDRTATPRPKKYTFVELNYASDDEESGDKSDDEEIKKEEVPEPECTLTVPVQNLMKIIFNQSYFDANMRNLKYDSNKLPLGRLSKATIMKGFQALKDLSALLDDNSLASTIYDQNLAAATESLSNLYYSLIPHAFGYNRPPIIRDQNVIKTEVELLESLADMKEAAAIMKAEMVEKEQIHKLDKQFNGLNMNEMEALDEKSNEFKILKEYLIKTRGSTHYMQYDKVEAIFRIQRHGESDRFEKSEFSKSIKDRRLLWHGSRATNFGGILSQGLRIAPPEAPVNGYMFGKGVYLADMSSKSANYCCPYISDNTALLLLCEAELGDPMQELYHASYDAGEDAKKQGMWTTWGQGMMGPVGWVDAGKVHASLKGVKIPDVKKDPGSTNKARASLQYNEFICYDVAQIRLRYLFQVKMS